MAPGRSHAELTSAPGPRPNWPRPLPLQQAWGCLQFIANLSAVYGFPRHSLSKLPAPHITALPATLEASTCPTSGNMANEVEAIGKELSCSHHSLRP